MLPARRLLPAPCLLPLALFSGPGSFDSGISPQTNNQNQSIQHKSMNGPKVQAAGGYNLKNMGCHSHKNMDRLLESVSMKGTENSRFRVTRLANVCTSWGGRGLRGSSSACTCVIALLRRGVAEAEDSRPQMGHCFSCFQDPTDANAPAFPAGTTHHKDEMTEISPASQARPVTLSDCTQAEPLLHTRGSDAGPQKCSNHCLYPNNHNTVVQSPAGSDPPTTTQKIHINNDKSQKSFYQKLSDTKVSETKINQLFDQYKEVSEDAILAEGIENLCNDLQLNPDEFKVLVLAWKLNASQMCRFTRAEFLQGLKNMKTDSIKGIQTRLTELTEELQRNPDLFKDLYRFTFKFGLDVGVGQRILPSDVAIVLWRLIFTYNEPPILKRWLGYLENNTHIRGIPKDTWFMFLNFCEYVREDLSSYDDTEAWPSLFDDFVEYENDQMNQNISKIDIKLQN